VKTATIREPRVGLASTLGRGWLTACARKARNVARGLIQRHATAGIKQRLWDLEFSHGRWNCLDTMRGDCVYSHVERYANGGSILDLGCGPGTTGIELSADAYARYTGVDISAIAVEKASKKAADHDRAGKNSYSQGDIFGYVPTQPHDVILFGDSIYYVQARLILPMLRRYSNYLKADGVFVARIYGRRYQAILDLIERNFDVLEKRLYDPEVFVIVFVPAGHAQHA
jgi:SAM-dependent methyltransferase